MSALKKNRNPKQEPQVLTPDELNAALIYHAESPEREGDILIEDGSEAYKAALNEIDNIVNLSQKAREDLKSDLARSSFLNRYARLNAKYESNDVLKDYMRLTAFFDWKILGLVISPVPEALKKLARENPEEVARQLLTIEGEERGIYLENLKRRSQIFKKVDKAWVIVLENVMREMGGSLMTPEKIALRFKND